MLKSPENKSQLKSCDDGKRRERHLSCLPYIAVVLQKSFFFPERAYHPPLTTQEAQVPCLDEAVSFLIAKVEPDKFHGEWWNLHYFVHSKCAILFS